MAYGLRAWAAAGAYPGAVLSPRIEKITVTKDRFGDRFETKTVSDGFGRDVATCKVSGRKGDAFQETTIRDPIAGTTSASRVRSESPRGLRSRVFLDDDQLYGPLYRGRAHVGDPLFRRRCSLADDVLMDSVYRHPLAVDSLYRHAYLADPLYRDDAFLARPFASDPVYTRSYIATDSLRPRSVLNEPLLYKGSCLDDPFIYGRPAYRYSKWADPNGVLDKYLVGAARADPYYDGWSPLSGPFGRPLARGLY